MPTGDPYPHVGYHKVSSTGAESPESSGLSRRSSVFSDLFTVLRKNTLATRRKASTYHAPPVSSKDLELGGASSVISDDLPPSPNEKYVEKYIKRSSEADMFGAGGTAAKEDEEDEDSGKPMTRQLLLDKIRQKKEVINKLRCQAWSMNRKRRTLRLAQKYLEQHESKVSKTHLYKEELRKRFRMFRRWFSNINTYLIPWESRIKKIESHFGSVVSSYFTFLRWVLYMNVVITVIVLCFITIPELLADATADAGRRNRTASRKQIPKEELRHADEWQRIWHFDGYLRYSPLFYGYYSNDEYVSSSVKYSIPLAYFIILLVIFGYSFFAILKKMASNAKMSKMGGSKAEQYIFNWKVFTGWDYSIGNSETASNNVMAAVIKLREAAAESHVKKKAKLGWLTIFLRILANVLIFFMIGVSIYCISFAFYSTATVETGGNLFSKNQVPSVMATITHVFPMVFDLIGRMESWHPRLALRLHLARVLVLYILNYCTFMYVLYEKYISHVYDLKMSATHEDSEEFLRVRRQLGGRNPNIDRPPPFASRNFINRTQVMQFLNRTTKKVPGVYSATQRPNIISHTGQPVTVQSQFGPFGVNHATAIVRNATMNPLQRRYETKRLGPPPLPVFSPPPPRSKPRGGTFRGQQFGPDWSVEDEDEDEKYVRRKPGGLEVGDIVRLPEEIAKANSSNINETQISAGEKAKITTQEYFNQNICWETMVGQEIVKLVTVDLYITIGSILLIDFIRGLWVKYCGSWWCWDIETTFPEYGEFKVAENVLHIINNQGLIWLGFFFAPMLPAINNIKLVIIVYIRSWAVMTCNVPAREIFRASRSSNFYLWILLLWLVFCTVPVGIAIGSTRPSKVCGPFAGERYFYSAFLKVVEQRVDKRILNVLKLLMNPGVIIPLLLFLGLIIYFLICLVRGLRRANTELQQQLTHERTEEKKKIFEMAGGRKGKTFIGAERKDKKHPTKLGQYLPTVEQKRREHWRQYNGTDQNSSLCVTDEPDSSAINSPSVGSPQNAPKTKISARGLEETSLASPGHHAVKSQFRPSLGSLDEVETSDNPSTSEAGRMKDNSTLSKSMSVSRSGPTERVDDWYNDGTRSDHSYDVQSAAIEIATPEEIRTFMKPLMEPEIFERGASAVSLAAFPKEISPLTVIFGTGSGTVSRRSSKRDSYISLYDNPSPDEWFTAAAAQSAAMTAGSVGLSSTSGIIHPYQKEMRTGSFSKAFWSVGSLNKISNTQFIQPLPQKSYSASGSKNRSPSPSKSTKVEPGVPGSPLAMYSKEPRRIQPVPAPLPLRQTPISKPTDLPFPKKKEPPKQFEAASFSDEFKPWPSIDEIKAQRGGLLPVKPPTPRSKSPPKMVKSDHKEEEEKSFEKSPARFRISVSPTRKVTSDSGSDTDSVPKKRRFVIKQRLLPGSSSSVASSKASATATISAAEPSNLLSPRAPRVEFGDDDSPRVQEPPPIPPHRTGSK